MAPQLTHGSHNQTQIAADLPATATADQQLSSLPPILRLPAELTSAIAKNFQVLHISNQSEFRPARTKIKTLAALCGTCAQLNERIKPLLYYAFVPEPIVPIMTIGMTIERRHARCMSIFLRSLKENPLLASFVKVIAITLRPSSTWQTVRSETRAFLENAPGPFGVENFGITGDRGEDAIWSLFLHRVQHAVDVFITLPRHYIDEYGDSDEKLTAAWKTMQVQRLTIDGREASEGCHRLTLTDVCHMTSLRELKIVKSVGLRDGLAGIGSTLLKSIQLHECAMPISAIIKLIRSSTGLEHFELCYRGYRKIIPYSILPLEDFINDSADDWHLLVDALGTHGNRLRTLKLAALDSPLANESTFLEPHSDKSTGSFRDFLVLELLSVPKLAILGPDAWRREDVNDPGLPNLLDRLPRSLRTFAMHGCSDLDIAQLRELLSGKHMTALARIDVEPMYQSSFLLHEPPELLKSMDGLQELKSAFVEAGIHWTPEAESDNRRLLPAEFRDDDLPEEMYYSSAWHQTMATITDDDSDQ